MTTLIVVSGPAGSGKTTLAHAIASAIGCPAICRDEIKEGMVHAACGPAPAAHESAAHESAAHESAAHESAAHESAGFTAAIGDELTARTLPVFFAVLDILLRAGVTTVAEAAFQDHVWRPRLEPLRELAQLRIVNCTVDPGLARQRIQRRARDNPLRRAHADRPDRPDHPAGPSAFTRISLDVPALEVDTADGYRPVLNQIVAFVDGSRSGTPT